MYDRNIRYSLRLPGPAPTPPPSHRVSDCETSWLFDGLFESLVPNQNSKVKRLAIPLVSRPNPSIGDSALWPGLAGDNHDWLPPTQDLCSRVRGSRKPPSFLTSTTPGSRERKFCKTRTEERSQGCQRVRSAPRFRHTPNPHFSVPHFIRYVGTGGRGVVTTYFP